MNTTKAAIISAIIFTCLGFGACYFLCCKKKEGGGTGTFAARTDISSAHSYAFAFRDYMGYCAKADCSNTEGFFVMTSETAHDFSAAIANIESDYVGIPKPTYFKCIFGRKVDDKTGILGTSLILVGMQDEYIENLDVTKLNAIQIVDGVVPCPKLCDVAIAKSVIISGTKGTDCCK